MNKTYNGKYWEISADEGKVFVNMEARVSSSFLCTADENATGWEEIPQENAPSFAVEDDLPAEEALDILTGVSE